MVVALLGEFFKVPIKLIKPLKLIKQHPDICRHLQKPPSRKGVFYQHQIRFIQ
jgi:hypothetical protein